MRGEASSGAAALELADVTFTHALGARPVLRDVSLSVASGGFALLVGGMGAGKSTLLGLCVPALAPAGTLTGEILVFGRPTGELPGGGARDVGIVLQDPDVQVICDDVRSEMAFGLEGLGLPQAEMARRIAETATFLGMVPWFGRRTSELSGGQRQVLALAATLVMRPRLLLLDEPTSQLDPVTAAAFASLVGRANRELGVTVLVATHDPGAFVPYATDVLSITGGVVSPSPATGRPRGGARPASLGVACPADEADRLRPSQGGLGDGRGPLGLPATPSPAPDVVVDARDLWFRHARDDDWVLSGAGVRVEAGEVRVVLGGNGTGKTTLLRLVAGLVRPQRGRLSNRRASLMSYLPQDVRALLVGDTVRDELAAWAPTAGYGEADVLALLERLGLAATDALLASHPHDLSGGQRRLLALAKVLLPCPGLLLLDEPTIGLDASAASAASRAITSAAHDGAAVLVATHDVAFARRLATTVSLLFDGRCAVSEPAGSFFDHAWLWGG